MKLTDIMSDYEVPKFFKRATGRRYIGENETCINDIRRMLWRFCQERHLTSHLMGKIKKKDFNQKRI